MTTTTEKLVAALKSISLECREREEGWIMSIADKAIAQYAAEKNSVAGDVWQPIETAPRKGVWCLYWDARYDCVRIARRGQRDMPQEGDWEYELYATHWMPLPAPPVIRAAQQGGEK